MQIKYHSKRFKFKGNAKKQQTRWTHYKIISFQHIQRDSQRAHTCRNLHKLGLPVRVRVEQLTPGNEHATFSQPLQREGVEFKYLGMQRSQVRGQSHLLRGLPLEGWGFLN